MGKSTRRAAWLHAAERWRCVRDDAMACAREYNPPVGWRSQWVRVAREANRRYVARLRMLSNL